MKRTSMFGRLFGKSETVATQLPLVDVTDRVYAVGDIHGRHDLLDLMFEKIAADHTSRDDGRQLRVVFLGDYVDRGDHTSDVLDRLCLIQQRMGEEIIFLSGNHEAALLDFLERPEEGANWLDFGGMQTLASYGVVPPRDRADAGQLKKARDEFHSAISEHLPFLRGLQKMWRSGDVVFVHAGLDPARPLHQQSDATVLWGSGNTPSGPTIDGLRIVHGHFDREEPVVSPGRVCVDTGAYYSGRLTAVRLDADEAFLVADALDL